MQHTEPVEFKENTDGSYNMEGLIALCNLGGINWGAINNKEDMLEYAYVGVRALDNILSMQYYPFTAAKRHNDLYRPIGVGITGLAYWLAKNGLRYDNCYELLDEWADFWSYSLIKASVELAQERGACEGIQNTKWGRGLFPVDYYPVKVDTITPKVNRQHWEELRPLLKEYGIRNATVMALMPGETSSKVSGRGTTNGVEPVRSYIVQKGGKSSKAKFVLPELERLKDNYDLVWEWKGCSQLIKTYAILQKYVDQGISCNTYYNKLNFDGERVPFNVVFQDILDAYSYGLKTLYYNNNQDDNELEDNKSKTAKVIQTPAEEAEDDYCESCTL